jgi:uncharacterized cupin superfamily protein
MRLRPFLVVALMGVCTQVLAAPQPVKLSRADLDGARLATAATIGQEHSELGPLRTEDVSVFLSSDRRLDAGVYRSGAARFTIAEPYGVDEFMYFLDGELTLTSSDGAVTHVGPGEAVTIPKAWTGVWDSTAYTKIYVIYSPEAPLPAAREAADD